jgi:hypothetical protein
MIFFYFTWVRETNKISFAHNKSREGIRQKRKPKLSLSGFVCVSADGSWVKDGGMLGSEFYREYTVKKVCNFPVTAGMSITFFYSVCGIYTTVKYQPPCKNGSQKEITFLSVVVRIRIDFGRLHPESGRQK